MSSSPKRSRVHSPKMRERRRARTGDEAPFPPEFGAPPTFSVRSQSSCFLPARTPSRLAPRFCWAEPPEANPGLAHRFPPLRTSNVLKTGTRAVGVRRGRPLNRIPRFERSPARFPFGTRFPATPPGRGGSQLRAGATTYGSSWHVSLPILKNSTTSVAPLLGWDSPGLRANLLDQFLDRLARPDRPIAISKLH